MMNGSGGPGQFGMPPMGGQMPPRQGGGRMQPQVANQMPQQGGPGQGPAFGNPMENQQMLADLYRRARAGDQDALRQVSMMQAAARRPERMQGAPRGAGRMGSSAPRIDYGASGGGDAELQQLLMQLLGGGR